MRGAALLVALLALPAWADCPCPPEKPKVARKAKPPAPIIHDVKGDPGPPGPKGDKGDPGTCADDFTPVDCAMIVKQVGAVELPPGPPPKEDSGRWLLGGGVLRSSEWGGTLLGGYELKSGWHFLVGPTYTPHEDVDGWATRGCVSIPFHVEPPGPWGAQALAVYAFK